MTKQEYLELLMLLSAMESWTFSVKECLPDYLHERLSNAIESLSNEVLK